MLVTICLIAHLIGLPRWVQVSCWVFLALTEVATVYLGWHFFVDDIAGAAIALISVYLGSRMVYPRGRPARVAQGRESAPV
jgi:membrane-associated phospholipid phosphatase